jgi:serine/threonine-protein kinase PknG
VPVSLAQLAEQCPLCDKNRLLGEKICGACGRNVSKPSVSTELLSQPVLKYAKNLKANDILHGKYRIQRSIGSGGMGIVYLAYDLALKRHVVIKGLLSEDDPELVELSVKEREFLAALKHANIIAIYDFITEGRTGYIVMEYVNGETLDAIMKRRRAPLAVPDAIRYILEILPAFDYLAKLDYVYCDFKPQNVMLETRQDGKEIVKLIDLGTVMKHVPELDSSGVYVTPGFYAREAINHPSPETDLYSICRTLAYLVSCMTMLEPMFGMPPATMYKVFQNYPALYRLLVKGTHEDPTRRFHTVQELSDQLQGVLLQIVGETPEISVNSRYFVSSTLAPRGKFGLLGETIVDQNQKDDILSLLRNGDQAFRNRDYNSATDAYMQCLRSNPNSIDAYTRLAEVYIEQEQFEEAQKLLERARESLPYHWKLSWYMGRLYEAQQQYNDASNYYREVRADLPGELSPQQALAYIEAKQGNYQSATRLYNDVLRADPSNIEATLGAADAFINLEDWNEATTILNRVNEAVTRYVDAQLRICEVYLTLIQPVTVDGIKKAAVAVNRLKGRSTDPSYYRARGDVYYAARKLALEGKLLEDTVIEGVENNDPRTLGKDASDSYEHYLRYEPHAVDREIIIRRKLEVTPWRLFLFI